MSEVDDLRRYLGELHALAPGDARSLSADFYTSADFLQVEQDELLRNEWMCIGHTGEVRNPGDFVTTELLGELLLVVRSQDGSVRVLSNVCRHRGNQVVEGKGSANRFVCAYHHWAYDGDGTLVNAPLMSKRENFDASACSLPEFAADVWNGWLLVNLSGTAGPLTDGLGGLDEVVANYHPGDRYLVFLEDDVWECNWKALFENFMEGYHLSAIHPETLHPITPTRLCKKMVSGDRWTGYHAYYDPAYPPRGPFHPDLTEDECNNSPMYGVYPNLVVGMATNFTLFMCLRPDGPNRVRIRWGVTGLEDDPNAQAVADYVALCRSFNGEDKVKLEVLQRALKTRHYDGGPLAPDDYEGTIWDFVQYLARHLKAGETS